MRGVVAAGALETAEAAAEVLRRGGNAVDAVVAACFATSVAEPTLTSLAGAGVMIVHDAASDEVAICDFFADAPGLGGERPAEMDFYGVELDFGPARQTFHIGRAAAAVPGVLPGLCGALERWGTLELGDVIEPVCRMAREGVTMGPFQASAARLLEPIVTREEAGRRQFCIDGKLFGAGDRFRIPALADTLEQMARMGWRSYSRQLMVPAIVAQFGPAAGGLITERDLLQYEVIYREPLSFCYRGATVYANPPPAAGGAMIALMLSLLERLDPGELALEGADPIARPRLLCQVMQVADEARRADAVEGQIERWFERLCALRGDGVLGTVPPAPPTPGSTTHVSVIDGDGGAAAVTFSYGEGNGHLIEGTGIMMNNLMGEEDLHPDGWHRIPAGTRLSTMMAPTLVRGADGTLTVLGSGGANRIRTALLQVISNLIDLGHPPARAVTEARVHFEQGVLNAEVYEMADHGAALDQLGASELVRFDAPNLFFGGVHVARRGRDGWLDGGGDPRRNGTVIVV